MTRTLFNENWTFIKENVGLEGKERITEPVNLPHTWNNIDGQDGGDDYFREKCWYKKTFRKPENLNGDELWVEFDGVNSIAEVYLNGKLLKTHEGGYSRFRVQLTGDLKEENELLVAADNRDNKKVYPKFADFTFYGGIYRNVHLIQVPKSHFELDYYASPSVSITPDINGEVKLGIYVTEPKDLRVELEIIGENAPVKKVISASEKEALMKVENPHLWNGKKDPYLYILKARLLDKENVIDEVEYRFGFRTFSVDPEKGFFLNGVSTPLRGVCRHQDRERLGNALTEKEHEEDMELIKEVGANTIRLAHYQQDEYFYNLADQAGMAVWAEIPFISLKLEEGHENEILQLKELILQNYNHPSIICWGISNEITISSDVDEDLKQRHLELNELAHKLDPNRLTTMAQLSALDIDSPMNEITDVRSYNIYYGWYGGEFEQNGEFMDEFHKTHPTLPLGISEYGAEAVMNWHSDHPEQGDYTEEYQALYHESMIRQFNERPYLWATHLWNMFDFGSDMREEGGAAGQNHKGLVTFDRKTKKEAFYLYKAYWNEEPMVHVCGKRFIHRASDRIEVKVYSNQKEVTLYVNNQEIETKAADRIFIFNNVELKMGENIITAKSGNLSDEIKLIRVEKPDPSYIFMEGGAIAGGIANWFDDPETVGDCFTVDDKIKDIMASPQGKALFENFMSQASGMGAPAGITMDEKMFKVIGSFTVRRLMKMAGKRVPEGTLEYIGKALAKIKK